MHKEQMGQMKRWTVHRKHANKLNAKIKKLQNMRQNMRGRGENKINPRLVEQEGNEIKYSRTRTGLYINEYLIST